MSVLIWITAGLLFLLLMLPVKIYIITGLAKRREEILAAINTEAIALYFKQFHPGSAFDPNAAAEAFRKYYSRQFGTRGFLIPLLLLAALSGILLYWSAWSVQDWLGEKSSSLGKLPALAVVAIMGAYLYCTFEIIDRWNSSGLSPTDLFWYSFRFAIAVPMAYSLASAFNSALALSIAFLIGAFPTKFLLKIARRSASKRLEEDLPESGDTELLKLSGVDRRIAECFAAEGLTTVVQLAYSDPVRLAIRTNLGFSYIVDVMSQALLFIYAGDRFPDFVKASLRGGYEICALNHGLKSTDPAQVLRAEARFNAIATELHYSPDVLRNLFSQVGEDPYTKFLYAAWG